MLRVSYLHPVLAGLLVMALCTGCLTTSGSPTPKEFPPDKLEQALAPFNYNGTSWIAIDPVGDHVAGETIVVTAQTGLPAGGTVLVQTWPVSFTRSKWFELNAGVSEKVTIAPGSAGVNTITCMIDTADFYDGTYILLIEHGPDTAAAAASYGITAKKG